MFILKPFDGLGQTLPLVHGGNNSTHPGARRMPQERCLQATVLRALSPPHSSGPNL